MKCLEKDRNRRYESASALAADIQRYLVDEPVLAGPPSAGYRLRKFVKRHRGPVLAATLVLLALVAGIVGTTLGLLEAEQARLDEAEQRQAAQASAAKAREEEDKAKAARNEAQHLAREEKTSRERAEKQLLRAEWLLYATQISMSHQALENQNLDLAGHHLSTCRADFIGWEYSYLFYQIQNSRQRVLPHPIKPPALALFQNAAMSHDGRRIVTATRDGTFAVWDATTGKELWTIPGGHPRLAVTSLAFSNDGQHLLANHGDTVKVWDAVTGKVLRNLQLHKGASSIRAALLPYRVSVLSFNQDGTITTWDGAGSSAIRSLEGFEFMLPTRAALSVDGRQVLYGGENGAVHVWDAATGRKTSSLQGHAGPVSAVAMSRDGKRIVSASLDQTVKVWDKTTGKELLTLKGHTGPVGQVAWLEDGKRIASGSLDKTVKIWDTATGSLTMTLQGYSPSFLAVSPDGKCLLGTGPDGALKLWEAGHRHLLP